MNAPLMNAVIGRNLGTWEYLVSTWDSSSQAVLSGWTTDPHRATRWYPEIAKQYVSILIMAATYDAKAFVPAKYRWTEGSVSLDH